MEPLDAGSSPEISAGPPAKRMRTDPPEGISRIHPLPPPPMPVQSLQKGAHTRAVTACQTCRNRKTKCDNQRPTCGYCAKTGGSCSYLEDSIQITSCDVFGPQILEAIRHLTGLVAQQQEQQQKSHEQNSDYLSAFSIQSPNSSLHLRDQHLPSTPHYRISHGSQSARQDANSTSKPSHNGRRASSPEGLDSILKWNIFPQPAPVVLLSAAIDSTPPPTQLPSLEYPALSRLERKYITYVHTKNPILNLKYLHGCVSRLAENGLDWSIETCLVSLVCALGALSEEYTPRKANGENMTPGGSLTFPSLDEQLALQHWGVAEKRLGYVVGQNSIEAVQCLCLTGIWYMYNMEPLKSWKYFNLASNSWFLATIGRTSLSTDFDYLTAGSNSLTVEQSLYFTCYKSECELTFELSLPPSILESIDYPHTFPSPPQLEEQSPDSNVFEIERRSWYYYLAEIACRHLINRILEVHRENRLDPSTRSIERMLRHLGVFETQLHEWYTSLPAELTFPIPWGRVEPLAEELSNHLRGRYLAIRELCYRPFVRLCVTQTLDINPGLQAQVTAVASQGLLHSMFRLQAIPSQSRHHGLWFQLRIVTTCSLILIASDRAQQNPAMNAAQGLELPLGWREQIIQTQEIFSPYWNDRRGGIWESCQIIQWALNGCGEQG